MPRHNPEEPANPQENPSMQQVRELLFGSHLKDMEQRFQRQEAMLAMEINNVRETMNTRLDSLENFLKSEAASLVKRLEEERTEWDKMLKIEQRERAAALQNEEHHRAADFNNERRERDEAMAQLNRAITATNDALEVRIIKVADTLDAVDQELRALMLAESGALSAKLEGRHQDAMKVVGDINMHMRQNVVYRSSLASAFAELAMKLSDPQDTELGKTAKRGAPDNAHE
ncbi:MAG: hypothetical protein FWF99_04205 [Desulfovibrionaceae bacterium]|nr:hypothetical protein [Desulfovibrionaceae bacterium]